MKNKRRYLYLLICLILCMFALPACSQEEALNDDGEPLTIEDVWTEEDKFSIWIDSVTEISVADAEEYAGQHHCRAVCQSRQSCRAL